MKPRLPYTYGAHKGVMAINDIVYAGDHTKIADSRALYEVWHYYKDQPDGARRFYNEVKNLLLKWDETQIAQNMKEPNDDPKCAWRTLQT